jgi:hypothetical protein
MLDGAMTNGLEERSYPEESTAIREVPPPLPAATTPELDVDAWFAQRDHMIESLLARRASLLEEVEETVQRLRQEVTETERRLQLLGADVEPAYAPATEKPSSRPIRRSDIKPRTRVKAKEAAPIDTTGRVATVLAAMSKQPEKAADIGIRAGVSYNSAWRALNLALKHGQVKRVGKQGKDVRWALA